MRNLISLACLFTSIIGYSQELRLDSLVHHNFINNHNDYTSTYSYFNESDYIVCTKSIKDGVIQDEWNTLYRDSLKIYSKCIFPGGYELRTDFQYDNMRREVCNSTRHLGELTEIRKSYWKETDLLTLEEKIFTDQNDTTYHKVNHFIYDDSDRVTASYERINDNEGKEYTYSMIKEYEGDTLVVENIKIYDEGKGLTYATEYTRHYPDVAFGDTVCTRYCKWNELFSLNGGNCCAKYTWGKQGTDSNWGYMVYRSGIIYGRKSEYSKTNQGYEMKFYSILNENGPENWREDIQGRFTFSGNTCVTFNEQDLPILKESFDENGKLQSRTEYYYKELKPRASLPLSIHTNCQIIYTLNPYVEYFDMYGRKVTEAGCTQFLIETGIEGNHRVLLVSK